MNQLQQRILIGTAAVIGLMLVFPPFANMADISKGFSFILDPPDRSHIAIGQLFAQFIGVGVIAGLLVIAFKDRE